MITQICTFIVYFVNFNYSVKKISDATRVHNSMPTNCISCTQLLLLVHYKGIVNFAIDRYCAMTMFFVPLSFELSIKRPLYTDPQRKCSVIRTHGIPKLNDWFNFPTANSWYEVLISRNYAGTDSCYFEGNIGKLFKRPTFWNFRTNFETFN